MPPVGEGTATLPFSHGSVSAVNRTGAPCSPSSSVATSSTTARPPTATQVPPGSLHRGGTSLPVCGADGWLHAASSAAATATLRRDFMAAQSGSPGALVNGERPSAVGKRLDRRIAELLEAASLVSGPT